MQLKHGKKESSRSLIKTIGNVHNDKTLEKTHLMSQIHELKKINKALQIENRQYKQAAQKLHTGDEHFRLATEAAEIYWWEVDLTNNTLIWSEHAEHLTDFPMPKTLDDVWATVHPEDVGLLQRAYLEALKNNKELKIEYRVVNPATKRVFWFYSVGVVTPSKNGLPPRIFGITQNITRRREAESALRESAIRLRFMAESMPQKVFTATPAGDLDYCNPQWMEFTGLPFEKIRNKGWQHSIHPDDLAENRKRWRHSIKTGTPFQCEQRFKRKDGQYRWHLSRALPLYDENKKITMWVGTNTDIHEQKMAAEELQHKNVTLMNAVIQGTNDAMYVKDREGKYIMVNPIACRLFGKKEKDMLGKNDFEVLEKKFAQILHATDQRIIKKGKPEVIEETIFIANIPHTFLSTKSPFKDKKGNVIGLIGVSRDITERKELEQRKDDFISMASHELKTPITSIKALGQILQREDGIKPKQRKLYLAKMNVQIDRMVELITDLLDISKIEKGRLELFEQSFDFDTLVKETIYTVQQTAKTHRIYLRGKTHATLVGDRDRIGQIIINLLTNAIKYSPNADKVYIRLQAKNDHVSLSVKDYGIGIPQKDLKKIFNRFYRVVEATDKTFPGLGVGLYISHQIAERHQGEITVKSKTGQGSIFTLTLPLSRASKRKRTLSLKKE